MEKLGDWIKDHCFTVKGGLNNRCCIDTWWENKGFEKEKQIIVEYSKSITPKTFEQIMYHAYNETLEIKKCSVCGRNNNFKSFKDGYFETCSIQCSGKSKERIRKIQSKLDHEKIHEKVKKTNIEKYGMEHFLQTEEFKEKACKTKLKRYGDEKFSNLEKNKQTCLEKYGVDHYEKLKTSHFTIDDIVKLHFIENKSCVEISKIYNVAYSTITYMLHDNGTPPRKISDSSFETELKEYLNSINVEFIENDRKILNGKELDIFIPSKNVAIEVNGIYWHSFNKKETKEEIYKHFNKFELCKNKGIRLIQFTDYELINKKDICYSILNNAIGIVDKKIRASKCVIKTVSDKEYKTFCNENHIQGYVPASLIYGLYFGEKLVSLMSFCKSRYRIGYLELLRFVNKIGYKVYGAGSKLFNEIKQKNISIISYCSIDYFEGLIYNELKFDFVGYSKPNYFYHKSNYNKPCISRISAQKHKLNSFLDCFDINLTEYQNMFNNGYRRYWNCGNSVWIYNNKKEKNGN